MVFGSFGSKNSRLQTANRAPERVKLVAIVKHTISVYILGLQVKVTKVKRVFLHFFNFFNLQPSFIYYVRIFGQNIQRETDSELSSDGLTDET